MSDSIPHTKPVFLKASVFPSPVTPIELCEAAEKTSGLNSVFGVQKVGGVYRLYPCREAARTRLLAVGLSIGGMKFFPSPVNPKRVFFKNGLETPASRLIISNLPLSVSEKDVVSEIEAIGYTPLTHLSLDCLRDKSGFLTRFKNGNRSVFIATPTTTLPKSVKIQGKFTAYLFYPEREEVENKKSVVTISDPPLPDTPAAPIVATSGDLESDTASDNDGDKTLTAAPLVDSAVPSVSSNGGEEGKEGEPTKVSQSTGVPEKNKEGEELTSVWSLSDKTGQNTESTPTEPPPSHKNSGERKSRPRAKTQSPRQRESNSNSIIRFLGGKRSGSRKRVSEFTLSPSKRSAPS